MPEIIDEAPVLIVDAVSRYDCSLKTPVCLNIAVVHEFRLDNCSEIVVIEFKVEGVVREFWGNVSIYIRRNDRLEAVSDDVEIYFLRRDLLFRI